MVVNTEQIFKGNTLEVKRLSTEKMEKLKNKESSEETKSTTVEVSGLPDGAIESSVTIHFQKKKNGGGEVTMVEMLEDGKARVIFEDPQGACHSRRHIMLLTLGLPFAKQMLFGAKMSKDCFWFLNIHTP